MKKFGFLLVFIGLFIAVLLPFLQLKVSGKEIVSGTVYTRADKQFTPRSIELSPQDNPVRIRVFGYFLPGGAYLEEAIPLNVQVTGEDGLVHSSVVSLSTSAANQTPSQEGRDGQPRNDATVLLTNSTPEFGVKSAGNYNITFSSDVKVDFSLSEVEISVLSNVASPNKSFRFPGIIAIIFGILLIFRTVRKERKERKRRRKRNNRERGKRRKDKRQKHKPADRDRDDDDDDDDDDDEEEEDRENIWTRPSKREQKKAVAKPPAEPTPQKPVEPDKPKKPAIKWGRKANEE